MRKQETVYRFGCVSWLPAGLGAFSPISILPFFVLLITTRSNVVKHDFEDIFGSTWRLY